MSKGVRLVDANALIDKYERLKEGQGLKGIVFLCGAQAVVDAAPTINSVIRGEWIPSRSMFEQYEPSTCECSVCGNVIRSADRDNYCPKCAAKNELRRAPE